jgi:predicted PurR-regulated permease PerM
MEFKTPFTFDKVVRMIIGLVILVLLFLLFRRLSAVLTPFFVGWLLAYLLHPLVSFFQYKLKMKSRVLSIITTLVLFFGSLTGIIMLLIPQIAREIKKVSELFRNFSQNFSFDTILPISWQNAIVEYFSSLKIEEWLNNPNFVALFRKVTPQIWDLVNSSLSFVIGLMVIIIVLLYLIFILKDYEKITTGWPGIIPPKYRELVTGIFYDIEVGMNKYFRGQALIALTVGTLFTIGFVIIDLPMAIIFGIFVGILNLVPYLQTVAAVPALFLIMLKASEPDQTFGAVLLSFVIVFLIVQSFQDLVLVPTIMGKVTGLKPAVILLSLSIWGSLMGIIGMIIALPLTTLIISYYNRWVLRGEDILPEEQHSGKR